MTLENSANTPNMSSPIRLTWTWFHGSFHVPFPVHFFREERNVDLVLRRLPSRRQRSLGLNRLLHHRPGSQTKARKTFFDAKRCTKLHKITKWNQMHFKRDQISKKKFALMFAGLLDAANNAPQRPPGIQSKAFFTSDATTPSLMKMQLHQSCARNSASNDRWGEATQLCCSSELLVTRSLFDVCAQVHFYTFWVLCHVSLRLESIYVVSTM